MKPPVLPASHPECVRPLAGTSTDLLPSRAIRLPKASLPSSTNVELQLVPVRKRLPSLPKPPPFSHQGNAAEIPQCCGGLEQPGTPKMKGHNAQFLLATMKTYIF